MKNLILTALLSLFCATSALADIDTPAVPAAPAVIEQLMASPTLYGATFRAVNAYAESLDYVIGHTSVHRVNQDYDRNQRLTVVFQPKVIAEGNHAYPVIMIEVLFATLTHYEITTGRKELKFYLVTTQTDLTQLTPQPGGIISAGSPIKH